MTTTNKAAQSGKTFPETTVIMTVGSQIDRAFNYIAPINLMHIFRGSTLIPAIVDTSIKEGWNKAGLVRTIYFKDGSTSQESLLTMEAPGSFSYKNDHFTSKVLGFLLKRLEGEWLFTDLGDSKTKIQWTYRAIPTNFFANLIVRIILMRALHSMLKNALGIIKNDLESGHLEGGYIALQGIQRNNTGNTGGLFAAGNQMERYSFGFLKSD